MFIEMEKKVEKAQTKLRKEDLEGTSALLKQLVSLLIAFLF